MTRRILKDQPKPRVGRDGAIHGCTVIYDEEWTEYRVVPTVDGRPLGQKAHYHTDDRDDAYLTAARMIVGASDK